MNKKWMAVVLILAFLLSGCDLVTRFEEAKDAYLENRVEELLTEDVIAEQPVEENDAPVEEQEVATEVEETEEVVETQEAQETPTPDTEVTEGAESDAEDDDGEVDQDDEDAGTEEEQETPEPTPTVESDDPGVYLGSPNWLDEMDTGEFWPTTTDNYMSVAYDSSRLKIVALSEINGWRIATQPVLKNAYIEAEVEMTKCALSDGYGIIFRVPENVAYNRGYLFGVTCDGRYALRAWDGLSGENGTMEWIKYYTVNEAINKGPDQTNRIGVMAVDDVLDLYVNGEKVDQIVDETYQEGFFGIYVNRDNTENLTIFVDNVRYWVDPLAK